MSNRCELCRHPDFQFILYSSKLFYVYFNCPLDDFDFSGLQDILQDYRELYRILYHLLNLRNARQSSMNCRVPYLVCFEEDLTKGYARYLSCS